MSSSVPPWPGRESPAQEPAPDQGTSPGRTPPKVALTVAGHDPSSGAGITADLITFAAHGLFGTSCITALTIQSTLGVREVKALPARWIADSLQCLEDDLPPAGIKIGMLGSAEVVYAVSDYLRDVRARRPVFVVLDPVLRSSSGTALLDADAFAAVLRVLLPLCDAATPNRVELFRLLGRDWDRQEQLESAAHTLKDALGGGELVVTGGDENEPDDFLVSPLGESTWLRGERIETTATHGTGCAFSSALLSYRLQGVGFEAAARSAKRYVEGALRHAPMLGQGRGPMQLLWHNKFL